MKKFNKNEVMKKIKICLFFVYILMYYIMGEDSDKIKYSEIILLLFLSLEGIRILKNKKIKYCIPIIITFVFTFYCFLSNFWAINPQLSINQSKTLFLVACLLLITYNFFVDINKGEEYILKSLMYAGVFFSIYVIMYYGVGEYFSRLISGERMGTEINNVNAIGLQTSVSFIIAIFYSIYDNKKIYIPFSIIPLIVSLGTGSRKVIILIVLGIILLFALKRDNKINFVKTVKKLGLLLIIAISIIFIINLPMFSTISKRFESMTNLITGEGKVDNSTKLRSKFIEVGIEQFLKSPIIGIGIRNSGYITQKININYFTYLHNNFIELLSTTGIIGFSIYYSVYFYIFFYCFKYIKLRNKYLIITLIIFLINTILEYGVVTYYSKITYVYILFGLVVIEKLKKENKIEKINKINKET